MRAIPARCTSTLRISPSPLPLSSSASTPTFRRRAAAVLGRPRAYSHNAVSPLARRMADKSTAPTGSEGCCADSTAKEKLPPLSDKEFKMYNRLAEHMDLFHNHFRQSWSLLWSACENGRRPRGMTLKQFLDEGLSFAEGLSMHHSIEERHFFPMLAKRMPEFRGDMQAQHREIHHGLEKFEEYLRGCKDGRCDFELGALRDKMSSWGEVLWTHLDDEVRALGANNMRRYWSKDDMAKMPF